MMGSRSFRSQFARRVAEIGGNPSPAHVLSDAELAHLPRAVAAYVRQSGAIGRPRVHRFHARIHGRIRSGAHSPWMPFTGQQLNTYGATMDRLFFMHARMRGLPVDVLHEFVDADAAMRVKLCSLFSLANASGPEMNRAETVTIFNDLCVLAPGALVDAPVTWTVVDDLRVRGAFTRGTETISAELIFDQNGRLVDFVSDDRLRASSDGARFTRQRWSTPLAGYRRFGPWTISASGEARWHAPAPEGVFSYLEFRLDDIDYEPTTWSPASVTVSRNARER